MKYTVLPCILVSMLFSFSTPLTRKWTWKPILWFVQSNFKVMGQNTREHEKRFLLGVIDIERMICSSRKSIGQATVVCRWQWYCRCNIFYGNGSSEISLINQTLTVVTIYWTKIGYCDICNGWVANESPKITQSILLSS